MKKIARVILYLSFALAVNLFCMSNAIAETDTDLVTIVTNNENQRTIQKTTIEVLDYEDVRELSTEPITSKDEIYYTEQN